MASLMEATERYFTRDNRAINAVASVASAVSPPTSGNMTRSSGASSPIAQVTSSFRSMISALRGINNEKGKQREIINRVRRASDEDMRERGLPIRDEPQEQSQEQSQTPQQGLGGILELISSALKKIFSSIKIIMAMLIRAISRFASIVIRTGARIIAGTLRAVLSGISSIMRNPRLRILAAGATAAAAAAAYIFGGQEEETQTPGTTPSTPSTPSQTSRAPGSSQRVPDGAPSGGGSPSENREILNRVMDEMGYNNPAQRAGLAAIIQGESGFRSIPENMNYSPERLRQVFPRFSIEEARQITAGGPEAVAEAVYGYQTPTGRTLGNTQPGDGWRYRGRGFIQLTGRSNYAQYSEAAGVDLVANPDALLDPEIAARVSVEYMKRRTRGAGTFDDQLLAVGGSRLGWEGKRQSYQQFLSSGSFAPSGQRPTMTASTTAPQQRNIPMPAQNAPEPVASEPPATPQIVSSMPTSGMGATEVITQVQPIIIRERAA